MKKFLALLALLALFVCCKKDPGAVSSENAAKSTAKKDSTAVVLMPSPSLTDTEKCSFFDPLDGLDIDDQLIWLKANEAKICESKDLKLCITDLHHMKQGDYDAALAAYWGTATPKFTEFTLDRFVNDTVPCTYSVYYVFDSDTNNNIFFSKQPYFSSLLCSYSIPFFQGLGIRYSLSGSSKLQFTKGIVNSQTVIIVSVPGVTDANFDYSHYPTGRGASCNPIKDKEYRSPQLRQSYGKNS